MKIRFITSYVPNSKFKLHRMRKFWRTYELQYMHCFFRAKTVCATTGITVGDICDIYMCKIQTLILCGFRVVYGVIWTNYALSFKQV